MNFLDLLLSFLVVLGIILNAIVSGVNHNFRKTDTTLAHKLLRVVVIKILYLAVAHLALASPLIFQLLYGKLAPYIVAQRLLRLVLVA